MTFAVPPVIETAGALRAAPSVFSKGGDEALGFRSREPVNVPAPIAVPVFGGNEPKLTAVDTNPIVTNGKGKAFPIRGLKFDIAVLRQSNTPIEHAVIWVVAGKMK